MFGQLLIVRIRAAEKALREGRLDEAFRLAMTADLREHRRGKAVLSELGGKFLERAREHYRADRFSEALVDLDRADAGAVKGEEVDLKNQVAELRKFVQTVAAETNRNDTSRRRRIDEAVRRIEDGSLAAGRRILDEASAGDGAAAKVREAADRRHTEVREVIAQAETALAAGQFAAATDRVRRAKAMDAHAVEVIRLESELCGRVLSSARAALVEGKLARAESELACLGDVGKTMPARREIADILALTREAARHLADGRYGEVRRCAMSVARLLPEAKWVEATIEQVRQMEELHAGLSSGPLGEKTNGGHGPPYEPTPLNPPLERREARLGAPGRGSLDETVMVPKSDAAKRNAKIGAAQAPARPTEKLLLLVDGGGSFLLVRGSAASVGRAAAEHPADVPIFSDLAERHVNVTRVEDDYFAFATKEIEIAGKKTLHTLLRDGDRVVLGRKAKFTFRLPSRRSATAVLELSDTTKMPNDVRRVILFDRAAMIGVGPTAHIPCRHAGGPLILYERNGAFWVRRQDDGHVDTAAKELPIGETVEVGGVSMVIRPWTMKA